MFWIETPGPGRLAIAARPRCGDWLADEMRRWRDASAHHVVSLLEAEEVHDLALEAEPGACAGAGLTFTAFPIPDRGVPGSVVKTRELVEACRTRLRAGQGVVIHCRAGIGRSSLVAACVLTAWGEEPQAAFARITAARGVPTPDTPAQAEWARMFAEG